MKTKYNNKKTIVDGIKFDSQKEARRYGELMLLVKTGQVKELRLQVRYPIVVNEVKVCTYVADFVYLDLFDGKRIVEDVKGVKTAIYRLKKKLMKAVHNINILET